MDALKNFEILSFIGEGAFGVVKLGQNKTTKEKVAIKILEKKKIIDKEDEIQVKREINILKTCNHINVIRVKNILNDFENIYIIMEYCEKGELCARIVEEICLEEKEAAYYYYQLINGLENIHKNGVVHRDLKPENLLINKNNILKIIDFGLSNYYDKNKLLSTSCGSPSYASPEMLIGKKYDGIMVDIWSTGIILYVMLCGCLPFEDKNRDILYKKIIKCKIKFPDNLEEDAIDLIKKILVNDPNKRITIKEIKEHPFYKKGKKEFIKLHPNLVMLSKKKNEDNNKEKNENIDVNKNLKRKKKTLADNLTIKIDENNIKNLEYNNNKIQTEKNYQNKIKRTFNQNKDFYNKNYRKKVIRKRKVPNAIYKSLTLFGNNKENFYLKKNLTNNEISREYNTNNEILSVSKRDGQLINTDII